jgi:hypothetical protein
LRRPTCRGRLPDRPAHRPGAPPPQGRLTHPAGQSARHPALSLNWPFGRKAPGRRPITIPSRPQGVAGAIQEDINMMHDQGTGWMWGFGLGHSLIWILILALLVLGLAAVIKYLFTGR